MKKEDLIIRISFSTLKKLMRNFYCRKDESMASYFHRLSIELEGGRARNENKFKN